uniref:Uncharacterized protein n=1 Tax=Trypanosoma vivax (strain Y486) TaxID=1055687 RepID=G0UC76_TRYVY|nr:hypothetical protein TVY486_1109100 [Trypanosoma vivax Y486]
MFLSRISLCNRLVHFSTWPTFIRPSAIPIAKHGGTHCVIRKWGLIRQWQDKITKQEKCIYERGHKCSTYCHTFVLIVGLVRTLTFAVCRARSTGRPPPKGPAVAFFFQATLRLNVHSLPFTFVWFSHSLLFLLVASYWPHGSRLFVASVEGAGVC